jgi:nucleoside-diphosphate-sugar epimerase
MKIFVAGGTGVLGRRLVPALTRHGHDVTVLIRSAEKARAVRAAGGSPVQVSLFDPESLAAAVASHEVVINVATSIPPYSTAGWARAWRTNDRIRAEGSRNLVDAAIAAGAARYVQESVAFLYADGGAAWITEGHPVHANPITASALQAEAQARRLLDRAGTAVVLRFGAFYGPDSTHTVAALRAARIGLGTTPGPRDGYLSSVWTDDAAAAVLAAATQAPPGIYNVVDDEPVTREEFDGVLAAAVGRRRLRPMPELLVRLSGDKLDHVTRSHRVSNHALRTATTWAPSYPSIRAGLPLVARAAGKSSTARSGDQGR